MISRDVLAKKTKKHKKNHSEIATAVNLNNTNSNNISINNTNQAISDLALGEVYAAITQGKSRQALNKVESLLVVAPNYKLLHLLRADLLLILSQKPTLKTTTGNLAALPALNAAQTQRVQELQQEAWLRLNSRANINKAAKLDTLPKNLLKLADNEPYALVVDSKASRLYVYQNQSDGIPKLFKDFYITQGKLGNTKVKKDDQRTPLGVYFIHGQKAGALPDFYGAGALPLDYPNLWDKRLGHTGHGIWLHGTPSDTYSRAPYASNGCVVLANPDIKTLIKLPNHGHLPVIITDSIEWVKYNTIQDTQKEILAVLEQWRKALENNDNNTITILNKIYTDDFKPESHQEVLADKVDKADRTELLYDKPHWLSKKISQLTTGAINNKITLNNIAILEYPNEPGMAVIQFDYIGASGIIQHKQLYFKKISSTFSSTWKIVLENL